MALEIHWSKRADKKFDKIIEYLESEWGEKVTHNFVKKVYDFLDNLSELPTIGTIENKEHNIRGFTIVKQVNIFYKIKNDKIIILNFIDNRQNPVKRRF
ncbi:MAG: type II toxin-antitoxin system RelE/ParE family toxin [Bacteroidetes bacterium]|jgi:plasmid stabilization system protein ParE|nr:type II toxin-antitoxin system RelE/ParE family toxin [Bacteroidota bacterium]MBT4727941.1 type II toxin-antitoxin system RelE/ParE family toxin [Bacteroidota bacterium]MBT6836057.1 type II toxin-antitoxin system RelE/ParE family toxin [Bacteroidota bacterium]MBT7038312.1 type II toxin-antitoxin system RelE/ParE family toxin [Bacteroidota bacterium]MBT7826392.1 type II toxin-antitoxin system RelE/ParE family toxin [Bacteroidota bacterium]